MSPGFDQSTPPDFTRIADESCLFCHNGYPGAGGVLAEGIDCQRCHGPGLHHVQLATEGKADKSKVRAAIVNPARLSPELQMDVCMQCHLETTSAEFPAIIRRLDRAPFSYVAGEPLGAYMVHFDHGSAADARERFEIAGQAYRLRQAACFRNSQGRLTCTVCHDPHAVERGATSIPYYRAKCVGCHRSVAAAGHPELASADCVSCHMPRRRTQDAVHVIMTDHLIQSGPASGDLTKPLTESARTYRGPLAVYYPQLSSRERDLYLGVAMITGGLERPGGIAMLERGLDAHSPAKAFAVLGEGYLAQGDPHAAVRAFRQAVERSPDAAKIHYNLAQALEAAGDMTGSRSEYERALHIQSVFPEAEYALGNLLVKSGEVALGSMHYQAAIRARPVYFEARNNLGVLYKYAGLFDDGMRLYTEAMGPIAAAYGHESLECAVVDHNVPTTDRSHGITDPISKLQVDTLDANCDRLGITVLEHTSVEAVEATRVLCADGTALVSDATVWTAGFAVSPIAAAGGLEVTENGRIVVDRTMRSRSPVRSCCSLPRSRASPVAMST